MTIANLLEKITKRRAERQTSAREEYDALVARIAAGDEPEPEAIEAVLDAAGKEPADIAAAVKEVHETEELRAKAATLDDLKAKIDREAKALRNRVEKLDAHVQGERVAIEKQQSQLADLKRQATQAERAEKALASRLCSPEEVEAATRIDGIANSIKAVTRDLTQAKVSLKDIADRRHDGDTTVLELRGNRRVVEGLEEKLAQLEAEHARQVGFNEAKQQKLTTTAAVTTATTKREAR